MPKTTDEQITEIYRENRLELDNPKFNTTLKRFNAIERAVLGDTKLWYSQSELDALEKALKDKFAESNNIFYPAWKANEVIDSVFDKAVKQ